MNRTTSDNETGLRRLKGAASAATDLHRLSDLQGDGLNPQTCIADVAER